MLYLRQAGRPTMESMTPRHLSLILRIVVSSAAALFLAGCAGPTPADRTSPTTLSQPVTTTASTSTTVASTTTTTTPAPPPTTTTTTRVTARPAVVTAKGNTTQRVVALTFDAGSDPGYTAKILDELSARHISATFGITGIWAQANPDLVRRIAAAGHQIVNHSWDHQSFTGASTNTQPLSSAQIAGQLARTENLIRQLIGRGSAGWFRPPYGDRNSSVDAAAGAAGYRWDLMWTVDTFGWKGAPPDTVVQRALAALAPGEIILMHVGSASTDAAALPAMVNALQARGYSFVTVSRFV